MVFENPFGILIWNFEIQICFWIWNFESAFSGFSGIWIFILLISTQKS
jgi:hypothetical protein